MKNVESSLDRFECVPGLEHLLISPEGEVYDIRARCFYQEAKGNYEYPAINAYGVGTLHIHRLLALAYLSCPGDPSIMEVNHKDGNKRNNALENLEWVTVSNNILHAYKTGLRPDNKPVLIKDLSTGKIERRYSLQECARYFKVNGEQISRYINNRDLYPYRGQYELIFEGEEWRGLTKQDIGKIRPGKPKSIVGLETETANVYVFNSMQAAADFLNVSCASVSGYVHTVEKKPLKGFILWPMEGFKDNLDNSIYIEKVINKPTAPKRRPVPITVKNIDDDTERNWDSVEAFGNSLGVNKNTIQKSMLVNDGRWKNYLIKYCPFIQK